MGVLSGSIYTYFGPSGSHYKLQVDWSATQDIANNQSTITAQLKMWSDPTWSMYTSQSKNGSITIDGTAYGVTQSNGISTGGGSWVNLGSAQSKTITHNADGTRNFSLSGSFTFANVNLSGTYVNTVNIPASTFTLNQIPRASTVTSAVSWTAGTQNLDVTIARADSSFHHTLELYVLRTDGSAYDYVGNRTGIGASTTWSFTQDEITQIYTTNSMYENRPVILRCYTYNSSGVAIGSYQDKSGTVYAIPTAYATINTNNTFNIGTTSLPYSLSNYTTGSSGGFTYDFLVTIGSGSTAFTKVFYDLTAQTGNLTFTTGTSGTSDVEKMYAATPNSNSVSGTVQVRTKYNGVYTEDGIPSTDITNITASVTNSNPTFSATGITYSDTNSTITAITGNSAYIVQNKSTVSVTIPVGSKATAKNGSTMSYYTATLGGVSQSGTYSATASVVIALGTINLSANANITITAYDSRGNGTPVTVAANILAYTPPVVNTSSARTNGFDPNTTITLNGSYSTLTIGGIPKNTLKAVTYAYKKTTDGGYPTGTNPGAPTSFTYTTSNGTITVPTAPTVSLDSSLAYNTQVVVQDALSTTTITNTVAAGTPVLFIDATKKSVGVGQFPANNGSFEVAGSLYANDILLYGKQYIDQINATMPATAGWYRIAQCKTAGIGNVMGTFEITCASSGYHTQAQVIAGSQYAQSPTLNVLVSSQYSNAALTQSRLVYPTNGYSSNYVYLEVYLNPTNQPTLQVRLKDFGWSSSYQWQLIQPVSGSIPANYTALSKYFDWGTNIDGVIAYGNTSNGRYVQYASGIQMCWLAGFISSTTSGWQAVGMPAWATTNGAQQYYYMYIANNWTFPAAFNSTPAVSATGDFGGVFTEQHLAYTTGTSSCGTEHGVLWTAGVDTVTHPSLTYHYMAIGTWR